MPVIQDELWKNPGNPGMIVVTSHAVVDEDGRLFMGYGVGKEAVRRIPEIEIQCGREVSFHTTGGLYGFLPIRSPKPQERIIGFGLFQTRIQWDDAANLEIIQHSMERLRQYTEENASLKIRMNFPGIGGGLTVEEVSPVLIPLPPTVTICHQGEVQRTVPDNFIGFKEIYLQVEEMLQEAHYNRAVEYLLGHGYDIQSAMEQVNAVERCLHERQNRENQRVQEWSNHGNTRGNGGYSGYQMRFK
jgi:hypothetical protein